MEIKEMADDTISRQAAIDAIRGEIEINGYGHIIDVLRYLPSARPEHTDCTECPEYDHETHSCPKYCETIQKTLEEAKRSLIVAKDEEKQQAVTYGNT